VTLHVLYAAGALALGGLAFGVAMIRYAFRQDIPEW
jgi:hypothetical protein